MKKTIIVLLITVLVAGLAFAATFTGLAGIDFGVDFDGHEWGFANYVFGQYKFSFELDTTKVAIGADHQTDVWAELAAAASASIGLNPGNAGNLANNATAFHATYTAKITTANIHVGDITFGILNAGSAKDFAKTYYKVGNAVASKVAPVGTAPGFTVSYKLDEDKAISGGFGAEGTWNEDDSDLNTYKIFAHVEAPTFKFADDKVTVDAAAYAFAIDKNYVGDLFSNYGGGFKAAYADEGTKISGSLAADVQYKAVPDNEEFLFEVAADAAYDFVTLNVYLASGKAWEYADEDPLKLDAKLSAKYTFDLNEDIALGVEGWVDARDTLIDALSLEVGAIESTTIDAFTVKLTEKANLFNLANDDDVLTALSVEAYVGYEHEKFTAYADLISLFRFDSDDNTDTFSNLYFEAGISSEAIIEGAELSLVYGDNAQPFKATPTGSWVDFLDLVNHKGAVTASCIIYF